jgi:hypothetical protein
LSAISSQTSSGQTPDPRKPPTPDSGGRESSAAHPPEFRRYRRFVNVVALTLISVGVTYMLASVGVTIYRNRHAVRASGPIDVALGRGELKGCLDELSDVTVALEKHLEKSHYLLGGYDQDEAQRWASEGDIWRNRWKVLGERCRLGQATRTPAPPEFEEMGAAYRELGETATVYTKELLRFGKEQAPRIDRLHKRITRIQERLTNP